MKDATLFKLDASKSHGIQANAVSKENLNAKEKESAKRNHY